MTGEASSGAVGPMSGFSHLQLTVSDVAASAEWYMAALGLESYVADPDIGYVALRHRSARVVIVLTARPSAPPIQEISVPSGESRPEAGRASLDHVAFAVPDGDALGEWAGHLTRIGIDHPGVVPENGLPSLQLRDPDGIAIELVAPSPPPSNSTGAPEPGTP
jgi:glyoxylase I family protein